MLDTDYYADPERYDAEYGIFSVDRDWYCRRALESGGPVLELGCGTGRILLALARAGLETTGLDRAPAMLDAARSRILLLGRDVAQRVDLVQGEFTTFSLPRRYRLVLAPLNALMHLLTDLDLAACLRRVRDHLMPEGRFIFDLTVPQPHLIAETAVPEGVPVRRLRIRGRPYLQRERHHYDPETAISQVRYSFVPDKGPAFFAQLRLRMITPKQIAGLLERCGFEILSCAGDFNGNRLDEDSVMHLYEVRMRP